MKRVAALCAILMSCLAAGCASSSSGAAGGVMFTDCYDDYCVGYDELYRPSVYLRTPSTPAFPSRAEVRLTEAGRPATQTVDRSSAAAGFTRPVPLAAPASPAPSRPPTIASRP